MRVIENVALRTCVATCRIDSYEALLAGTTGFVSEGLLFAECDVYGLSFEKWVFIV